MSEIANGNGKPSRPGHRGYMWGKVFIFHGCATYAVTLLLLTSTPPLSLPLLTTKSLSARERIGTLTKLYLCCVGAVWKRPVLD